MVISTSSSYATRKMRRPRSSQTATTALNDWFSTLPTFLSSHKHSSFVHFVVAQTDFAKHPPYTDLFSCPAWLLPATRHAHVIYGGLSPCCIVDHSDALQNGQNWAWEWRAAPVKIDETSIHVIVACVTGLNMRDKYIVEGFANTQSLQQ